VIPLASCRVTVRLTPSMRCGTDNEWAWCVPVSIIVTAARSICSYKQWHGCIRWYKQKVKITMTPVSWQFNKFVLLMSNPLSFSVHGPPFSPHPARHGLSPPSHFRRSSQILSQSQRPVTAETKHRAVSKLSQSDLLPCHLCSYRTCSESAFCL
jgi:hypothetical protein